jgi:hypothetical protein
LVTTITDREGTPVATLYDQYRIPTEPDEISEAMKWALISVEDRRFHDHHGIDWKGTVRAALNNASGGDTRASWSSILATITQPSLGQRVRASLQAIETANPDKFSRLFGQAEVGGQTAFRLAMVQPLFRASERPETAWRSTGLRSAVMGPAPIWSGSETLADVRRAPRWCPWGPCPSSR